MTVSELIEKLKEYPCDINVFVYDNYNDAKGNVKNLKLTNEVEQVKNSNGNWVWRPTGKQILVIE